MSTKSIQKYSSLSNSEKNSARMGTEKRNRNFDSKKESGKAMNDKKKRYVNKKMGTALGAASKAVVIEPHKKFDGVYVGRGKSDLLLTLNADTGHSVYGEKRVTVSLPNKKLEYRVWNCYRSKLAAGIACGLENIFIRPQAVVLYLGAANGTTLSHVAEIVGKETLVYAVEFSQRSGRDLLNLAMKRSNIVPIIADARMPSQYRMLVPMVDVIFSDVSQPDQSRIVMENAKYFLKNEGGIIISIKASCVNSAIPPESVFADEVNWLRKNNFIPIEQVTLEPYEKNHAMIIGKYKEGKV